MDIPESHVGAPRLTGAEFAIDPARVYRELRREYGSVAPVLLEGDVPVWLVLSYREVHHVTSNPQIFSRNSAHWNFWEQVPPDWPFLPVVVPTLGVIMTEGAEHQRRASAISDALEGTDRVQLARVCEHTADQLIDAFVGQGRADLITDYAQQVPIRVVSALFGLPESEIPDTVTDSLILSSGSQTEAPAAAERLSGRLAKLVAEQRQSPGSGLVARLVGHPAGLSDEELIMDMFVLVIAGQQPLADWIANTLRLMLLDDQFSLTLQGGRGSVGQALNQVMWDSSPIQNLMGRWATQDCMLGGQHVRKGDMVIPSVGSANADSMAYAGTPQNVGGNRAHLSFAHGEHSCPVGAPEIAEVIARTAIEVLLDRIPDVELAVAPEELRWKPTVTMRALESLPVAFTPRHALSVRG